MTDIMQVNQNVITYHIRHPSVLAYLIMRPPCRINAEICKCLAISQSSESFLLLTSAPPRIQGVEIFSKIQIIGGLFSFLDCMNCKDSSTWN